MCRFDPESTSEIADRAGFMTMIMKGKELKGYCYVDPSGFRQQEDFEFWVNLCLDYNERAKASKKWFCFTDKIWQMNYQFRKANLADAPQIWDILEQAIIRRKEEGSNQWQDGYPNPEVVQKDIETGAGFVLTEEEVIIGYSAVIINDEPAYEKIDGKWLSNNDFVVVHRVAVSQTHLGKGFAKIIFKFIEDFAMSNNIYSIKVDTNYDNLAMMKIFDQLGYTLCGKVYFRGSPREAYEKVLASEE
jgi:GNAT superfamily N-acetyltransferase